MFLLACARHAEPEIEPIEVHPTPVLPAMVAPLYVTENSEPRDELVRGVVQGLHWDETLSGAAAAIALSKEVSPTLPQAVWAAVRAGYPYPVVLMAVGIASPGRHPPDLLARIRAEVQPGDHVGLVRANQGRQELWVGLIGRPTGTIESFPREVAVDGALSLATDPQASWFLVSPTGEIQRGTTPASPVLDEEGEWWLDLRVGGSRLAAVPIFAGVTTPTAPLLDLPGDEAVGPDDAADLLDVLVEDVRDAFDLPVVVRDSTLDTLARSPLLDVMEQRWDRDANVARLQAAGFVGGPTTQVHCSGSTVATCVDQMLNNVQGRSALLNPDYRVYGSAQQVRTNGVTVVLNLASE